MCYTIHLYSFTDKRQDNDGPEDNLNEDKFDPVSAIRYVLEMSANDMF